MPTKIIYTPHYTVVGSPTISSEYVVSGFSSSNYLTGPSLDSSQNFEIVTKFTMTSRPYHYCHIIGTTTPSSPGIYIGLDNNNHYHLNIGNGSSWAGGSSSSYGPTFDGTDNWIKCTRSGTSIVMYASVDGVRWTQVASITTSYSNTGTLGIGAEVGGGDVLSNGSMDLKECCVKVDGAEVWRAVTWEEVEVSGSVSVSKGYYDNGSNKIQMTSAMTKNLLELSSGETIGCKNKLFAYSYNNTPGLKITDNSNSDITTTHDVSVELDKNVYLSAMKNYIVGHTPLQTIPMQVGGELTPDYTANDPSSIDSDYILHSTAQGKYVYKNFSESDITTGEITLKCKQTAIKYRSDVIAGWALIGFAEGHLGMWDGGSWRTGNYYAAGTWVWVKVVYTSATSNFKIYGLVDNGYTLETLPDTSQWTLEYNGQPSGTHFMTQALYLPDAGGEWFQGDIDLKTVQVKKNGVEIWRAVTTPTNAIKNSSNGFAYDSTNDKTFWYPSETILELRNFTDLQDRCNLYLANEDGKDVSRFIAGSSLPGPVKTNYVVEGSPTINSSYEASNFTNDNYISIPETIPSTDGTTIITAISLTGSPPSDTGGVLSKTTGVPNVYIHDSMKLGCYDGDYSQAGSTTMLANTKYWLGIRYYSSATQFFLLQDNGYTLDTLPPITNWNLEFWFSNKNEFGGSNIILGKLNAGLPFTVGTIYLEDTAIYSGGTYVWKAVEQNPVITSAMQQGYVYLNHAHNEVLGIGEEPDEIVLEAVATPVANYTVVGSPAISDDYVASGFSSSNYISAGSFNPGANSWEIGAKVHTKSSISGTQWIFVSQNQDHVALCLYYSNPDVNAGSGSWYGGQVWTDSSIATNTDYWYKMTYDGTRYAVLRSTDGTNYTEIAYISDSRAIGAVTNLIFGIGDGSFVESIDLKTVYIKVNGVETWRAVSEGAITEVSVSKDHYWTYLNNKTYNAKGATQNVSSMTGTAISGSLLYENTLGILYTENNTYYLSDQVYTGYTVTFTDTSHTAISSLTKTGTRCRVYSYFNGSVENPIYKRVFVTYEEYEAGTMTGIHPTFISSNIETKCIVPTGTTSGETTSYNPSTDVLTINGNNHEYAGDWYVDIGA